MSDGPAWFSAKRYGYGSGLPIRWQGWVVTLGFIAISTALSFGLCNQPAKLVAALTPFVLAFLVICARTTRGGWRWRWGEED